ncbi:MAG: DUF1549 domain-containing protein, partial [Planctomycetes bacterium]|nr:DUF1549 domain-containing protein [Planctomycetota bacterium]
MRGVFPSLLIGFLFALPRAADSAPPSRSLDGVRAKSVRLTISPGTIRLSGRNRRQQILVTAVDRNGKSVNVTHQCRLTVADSRVVSIQNTTLFGVANGRTRLEVRFGKLRLRATVSVTDFATFPAVHFVNDIIPIFSKLGCNSGGCHGKPSGQNGFRLSVFGSDPKADFSSLVKESRGRRAFPADPDNSLLVRKATGRTAHGGGRRTEPGSLAHSFLREWVRQGMPWGAENAPRLSRIVVEPESRVMDVSALQQIRVTAVYSDGRRRDVTAASTFTSNTVAIAEVDRTGLIRTGKNPGEAAMTVNYMGQVAAVRILVPRLHVSGPYPVVPENNRIDRFVWTKLKRMGIVPSALCDDATFLRRLYLDTIGTLPTPKEVKAFLADKRPDKRRLQIDLVLNRAEFADYWALKFSDILLVNSETLGERGAYQFHRWLRKQFAENRPYDQWVRELLTATGDTSRNGPVNFYRALRQPDDLTRAVSQAFLGIRLDCCQCHHHPHERWGREDFYGLAGFFNGIKRVKR